MTQLSLEQLGLEQLDVEPAELDYFLEAIYRTYGYDFREYARASLRRRLRLFLHRNGYNTLNECLPPILQDSSLFSKLLYDLLVSVTELFRDPSFFKKIVNSVFPILHTYPFVKIWHAGCASGEEVYSLAILLQEMGLSKRVLLYGTDINHTSLRTATEGIYTIDALEKAQDRYKEAGGQYCLSKYYVDKYNFGRLNDSIRENIVFSSHNLTCGGVFSEMHLVLCRNVLIYFKRQLQDKTIKLFEQSLAPRGFLCLGPKESIDFLSSRTSFEPFCEKERIYRKRLP